MEVKYSTICNTIIKYLIDEDIIINENDTNLNKISLFLLRYKRIISIILLLLLLIIGYYCNIYYFYNNNNNNNIINGGFKKITNVVGTKASVIGSSIKTAALNPGDTMKRGVRGTYRYGENRANEAKAFAPWFYSILYSIAISFLMFLIFMPAVAFFILGIICYSILKGKIGYIKSL